MSEKYWNLRFLFVNSVNYKGPEQFLLPFFGKGLLASQSTVIHRITFNNQATCNFWIGPIPTFFNTPLLCLKRGLINLHSCIASRVVHFIKGGFYYYFQASPSLKDLKLTFGSLWGYFFP